MAAHSFHRRAVKLHFSISTPQLDGCRLVMNIQCVVSVIRQLKNIKRNIHFYPRRNLRPDVHCHCMVM